MTTLVELTDVDIANLMEIQRLHDEAFQHARENDEWMSHKSSEGWVEVGLGNFFDRNDDRGVFLPTCSVYSYVFGPGRMHHFESIAAALTAVRKWHKDEMERDYEAERKMWEDATTVVGFSFGPDEPGSEF